ncbi:MAG: hypothetical protein EOM28_12475 [Clostridia bacterium]|nr:hypothetical protein [Clostridia bacterium]
MAETTIVMSTELITDRTLGDVLSQNEKGTFNASDLNRVGTAAEELRLIGIEVGYPIVGTFRTNYMEGEIPLLEEMEYYLSQVHICQNCFFDLGIPLPHTMDGLDYMAVNNMERLFVEIEKSICQIHKTKRHCGTANCGEGDGLY